MGASGSSCIGRRKRGPENPNQCRTDNQAYHGRYGEEETGFLWHGQGMRNILFGMPLILMPAFWSTAFLALCPVAASAQAALATDQFILVATPKGFAVQAAVSGTPRRIAVPRTWLIPPAEEKDDGSNFVSSFKYGKRITSFDIGNGKIGLHLASFESMTEGSARAAAGRDVFLVYDPASPAVARGLMELGITQARERDAGCFSAHGVHFLLADINRDGLSDIGLVKEVIECPGVRPLYSQQPVRWYVFRNGRWRAAPAFRGQLPQDRVALPLIGMVLSPVDYVAHGLWRSHDPAKWDSRSGEPVPYLPPYRRQIISK